MQAGSCRAAIDRGSATSHGSSESQRLAQTWPQRTMPLSPALPPN